MKSLRKNVYAVTVLLLFTIATAMLVLFLALYSSSTSVDGTVVGSVYIGDAKPNTKAREEKLRKGVQNWQNTAIYTIFYQDVNYVIGRTIDKDENDNIIYEKKIDEETGLETDKYLLNERGRKIASTTDNGLTLLTFDYVSTNSGIKNGIQNDAVFYFTDDDLATLKDDIKSSFGTKINEVIDYAQLEKDIIKNANKMNTKCDFDLFDYIPTSWKTGSETKAIEIEGLSKSSVEIILKAFKGKTITFLPQSDEEGKLGFSAVEYFLSDSSFQTLTSSDMSIVATGLAAIVQKTSLIVTVKNQGYLNSSYYSYEGMTARVNVKDGTDLRIINPENHPYEVEIKEGREGIDNTMSLSFQISGPRFIHEYEVVKNVTEIPYSIVYDDDPVLVLDDPIYHDDPNYPDRYYHITRAGVPTYLYSYSKIVHYVDDGTTNAVTDENGNDVVDEDGNTVYPDVYPKQEFIIGKDELREWKIMVE